MDATVHRRTYDSSGRRAQAQQTRERILVAAIHLFAERGYARTSVADIAAAAGVSSPTVFAGFRSKVNLFRTAVEVAIVGDDEPVPLAQRPLMRSVHEAATFDDAVIRLAGAIVEVAQRAGSIAVVAYAAADADPQIANLVATLDAQRLTGAAALARTLAGKLGTADKRSLNRMRDTIWLLNSPLQWDLLVRQRGWPIKEYRQWLLASLRLLSHHAAD